jgi:hypothetical protein
MRFLQLNLELNQPLILPQLPHMSDIAALASKVVELRSKIVLISVLLKV